MDNRTGSLARHPHASRPGRCSAALLGAAMALFAVGTPAAERTAEIFPPVRAAHGMVASQEATATRAAVEVLRAGGNAIDAAVSLGFTLAVTLPQAGNLGGGGFMVVRTAAGETVALDYREMAPAAADSRMFLDDEGNVDGKRARFSHLSAGVPGSVAGLALAQERWGTMPLARLLEPAIRIAREGLVLEAAQADSLNARRERFAANPAAAAIFIKPDGTPWQAGDRLVQTDLAWTLGQIAARGAAGFYSGEVARRIAADSAANGGVMSEADLAAYRAVERQPVRGSYRGYEIVSMPPPSSGGVHLVQMLNVLEGFPIGFLGPNSADTIHLMAETMRLAYADRATHLGDPDYWPVPVAWLTSKDYAAQLRARIDLDRARPSSEVRAGTPPAEESPQTTHFSVMDAAGNAVSNTYTLNFGYGSGRVAAGTGVLLNNEMDDFSAKPGVPNAYGLVGGEANAIAPGKRPLSSMTPTLVLKDGQAWLATGSPGGSRIITTTLQVIMNVIDHDMNIATAMATPRVHHQWLPDELRVERGLSPDTLDLLALRGHRIVVKNPMGSVQSVQRTAEGFEGSSDPRRAGALTLGW